jgi:cysteine-rich repeat protein
MKTAIFSALIFLFIAGCTGEAGLRLTVKGEERIVPQEVNKLRITYVYYDIGGERKWERGFYAVQELPQSVIVYKGSRFESGVKFWVDGFKDEEWRVAAFVETRFPSSGFKDVAVELKLSCLGRCLSPTQYCLDGACRENESSDPWIADADADGGDDQGDGLPEDEADVDMMQEDVPPICGNSIVDPGEECDDGNTVDGDGCDGDCTFSCRTDNDCSDGWPCTDNFCDLIVHRCTFPTSTAGTLCRTPAGYCDIEERCDGSSPACPPDSFVPSGQDCDDGQICTRDDACDGNGHCTGTSIEHLFDVVSISSGLHHTCALLGSGEIRCWGLNDNGQLGDGTVMNRFTPTAVAGLPGAAQTISCGNYHTCAVLSTGGISCWGDNVSGQLGDGTMIDRTTPVEAIGLPSSAISISAGHHHTCALLSTGGVMCWGQNSYCQLGNGSTTGSPFPVQVSGLDSGVVSVAAGGYHSCATLTPGGTPRCWGYNSYGQVGDGSLTCRSMPVAVSMPGSATAAFLALGRYHTCIVTTAGEIMCWGYNNYGQLGDGSSVNRSTAILVEGLTIEAVTMSLGYYHTCSVLLSNEAYCWGRNDFGQLGDGTTNGSTVPVLVAGLGSTIGSLALGYDHTCALLTSGEMSCWGLNNCGQLGNGTMLDSVAPVPVSCQ